MYAYMRLLEEEGMEVISTYVNEPLRADVIIKNGVFGIKMFDKYGEHIKTELYKGHSEIYAENAAENYVFGIKSAL
tara:strand:+ start:304 stop:531 length:228 start_codon:yes stop_codon:yes gene_type:complete